MEKYIISKENSSSYEDVIVYPKKEYLDDVESKKYMIRLSKSGIPKNYWDINFEDYKGELSKDNLEKSIKYSEGCEKDKFHNVNLYLYANQNGTQKTMVACNIGKEFLKHGYSVKFFLASEVLDVLLKNQGYGTSQKISFEGELTNIERVLNVLYSADLLIIDDIFDSKKSVAWKNNPDLIISAWDGFLRRRIGEDKRIVMTSNYPINNLGETNNNSLSKLLERNFIELDFLDSITNFRKDRFTNIFED
jgi:DNA replication protein DnaC